MCLLFMSAFYARKILDVYLTASDQTIAVTCDHAIASVKRRTRILIATTIGKCLGYCGAQVDFSVSR